MFNNLFIKTVSFFYNERMIHLERCRYENIDRIQD